MGDNLSLAGRTSVRTPMQWSPAPHSGFSKPTRKKLVHPLIRQGVFSFKKVNVLTQQKDPDSLLNFVERLITTRKQAPEIGSGNYRFLKSPSKKILLHMCETESATLVFVHNFSDELFTIPITDLIKDDQRFFEVFRDANSILNTELLILAAYGFIWFKIENI
jgi:maltose alpha-D-glucosyltransferase/alpha-amylase